MAQLTPVVGSGGVGWARLIDLRQDNLHASMPDRGDFNASVCDTIVDKVVADDERPEAGDLQAMLGVPRIRKSCNNWRARFMTCKKPRAAAGL